MKIAQDDVVERQTTLHIELDNEDVEPYLDRAYKKVVQRVNIPGFRKGKAPLNIVKKKYENNILSEIIEKLIEDKTKKLLEDKKLKAFRQPKVEIKKYEKNKPVEISIKVDLEPSIKIFPFSDLELKKRSIELDKKTLEENYSNFILSQKHYHKVHEVRPVKLSDKIIVNISTEDNSLPDYLQHCWRTSTRFKLRRTSGCHVLDQARDTRSGVPRSRDKACLRVWAFPNRALPPDLRLQRFESRRKWP